MKHRKERPENFHYCFIQCISFQLEMVNVTERATPSSNGYFCYLIHINVNYSYSQINCWSIKEFRLGKGYFLPVWNMFGSLIWKEISIYIQEKTMPKYGGVFLEGLFQSNIKQYEKLRSLRFQGLLTPTIILWPSDHILTFICFRGKYIIFSNTVNMVL